MNKVARNIMAEYCFFSKEKREELKSNPAINDVLTKVGNKRARKETEFSRYLMSRESKGIKPSPELLEHLKFLQS